MTARAAWNPQKTELATKLWISGESGNVIGKKIGMTRVQVIGKMHRLGLADRGTAPKQMDDIASVMLSNPEVFAVPVGAPDPEPVKAPPKKAEPPPVVKVKIEEAVRVTPDPVPVEVEEVVEPAPAAEVEPAPEAPAPVEAKVFDPDTLPVTGTEEVPIIVPARQGPRAASDGSEGKLFMRSSVSRFECSYPLWGDGDNTPIEEKRVCGCRTLTGKSWCPDHYRKVFDLSPRNQKIRVPARV